MRLAQRPPTCAAVVATRGRGDKIAALLESIMSSDLEDFELVIVDQSSDDSTERAVQPFCDDERLTYLHTEVVGVSRARNTGIALTTAPFIAITDDDCIVPTDWMRSITAPFVDDPGVGVVFCSVEPVPVDSPGYTPHIIFDQNRSITSAGAAWRAARGGLCLGAGMAVRRTAFDDAKGFDEIMGPGARFGACEDNDLVWRTLLAGWSMYQTGDVVVVHDGFRDLDDLRDLVIRDFYGVGGAVAKYLRSGKFGILAFVASWIWRLGIVAPTR